MAHRVAPLHLLGLDGDTQTTEPGRESRRLHGGAHVGAAARAIRTRASVELQHHQGRSTLLALLDCSKCYERVGHVVAGSRALASGLPGRIANMIFDM